jgi:hypothetical protein
VKHPTRFAAVLLSLAMATVWQGACSSSVVGDPSSSASGSGGASSSVATSGNGSTAATTGVTTGATTGPAGSTTGVATGSSGASTSASSGSGGGCAGCGGAWKCCNNECVAPSNDVDNCGQCGNVCTGAHPYCDQGTCAPKPPCDADAGVCPASEFCCGGSCCALGEICCDVPSNLPSFPQCVTPVNGTCPKGCNLCP